MGDQRERETKQHPVDGMQPHGIHLSRCVCERGVWWGGYVCATRIGPEGGRKHMGGFDR